MKNTQTKPPAGLSVNAKSWWKKLIAEYDIDDQAGLLILETAMRAMDRMTMAAELIEEHGRCHCRQVRPAEGQPGLRSRAGQPRRDDGRSQEPELGPGAVGQSGPAVLEGLTMPDQQEAHKSHPAWRTNRCQRLGISQRRDPRKSVHAVPPGLSLEGFMDGIW